ncbi:hypothetical protein PT7_2292 [Pusillimonas sp. T7-7]|uniref:Bug family tripartite tricarboxylate transporter substrate binding protein n=1 Tax=Pusillimonas sp. (strain T7-7) TaxID=1007105 RepID=UPI00020856CB|nr:tripartite tricarboxylate transporter substrate binding protein [Pusillimonas sp. T7-7]AEC20832.1 hypothetical protein PT7_2292 [Pusillimonas sp. T7-7]
MDYQRRKSLMLLSGACAGVFLPALSVGKLNNYPSKAVNVVVPYGAGGSTDLIARLLVSDISSRYSGKFFVENKAGAAGNIGVRYVASSAPDGATLLYSTATPFAINPFVYKTLPFDPDNDLIPIARTVQLPLVLVVNKEIGVSSIQELIDYLKKNEDKCSFSSYGVGTSSHIAGANFVNKIGVPDVLHVPYKDMKAMPDLAAGRNTFHIDAWSVVAPLIDSGKLLPLAVSSSQSLPWAPELPTIADSIGKDYEIVTWHAVFAPKGTPAEIVDFLNGEFKIAVQSDGIRKTLKEQGFLEYPHLKPAEVAAFIDKEKVRWKGYVETAGIEPM